ncbi:MAG TPA: response regulator [Kofleriaceae bacterium]|nr:response regulator [Kofleriaceae bacterium]
MTTLPLIVCVDDDPSVLTTVARCLRREQLDVRTTESPLEALRWIAADDIAVVVCDYEMPTMTGAQLAGKARMLRPETVRILLTGRNTVETAVDGINQGEIFRFIAKPFDFEELRACVLAAVERHVELVEMTGDRQRRERRVALRTSLETEYPGISDVRRGTGGIYEVESPWDRTAAAGFPSFTAALERDDL